MGLIQSDEGLNRTKTALSQARGNFSCILPAKCLWAWTVTLPWKSKLSIYSEDFRLDLHDYVSGQFLKINLSMKTHLAGSVFLMNLN